MITINIRVNAPVLSRFLNSKTTVKLSMTRLNYSHILTLFDNLIENTDIRHLYIQSQDITILPSAMLCSAARKLQSLKLVNCRMTYEQKRDIWSHFPNSNILISKKTHDVALLTREDFFYYLNST